MSTTLFIDNNGTAHLVEERQYTGLARPWITDHPEYFAGELSAQEFIEKNSHNKIERTYVKLLRDYLELDTFLRGYVAVLYDYVRTHK